jgi:hypothetical protein
LALRSVESQATLQSGNIASPWHSQIEICRDIAGWRYGNKMKQSAVIYPATLTILFPLDFIFLRTGRRLFGANARDLILDDPTPAILFCVIYVACTQMFNSDS